MIDIFTTTTATTMATRAITTVVSFPRVQMDAPDPRVLTRPPWVKNILTPVPAMIVEYPQAT